MTHARTFTATLRDDGAFEVPFGVRAVYGSARPARSSPTPASALSSRPASSPRR